MRRPDDHNVLRGCAALGFAAVRRWVRSRAAVFLLALACCADAAAARLPDWSGQWEFVGATPSPSGGMNQSLEEVLTKLQWDAPNKPEVRALVEQQAQQGSKARDLIAHGTNPLAGFKACAFGFPLVMLESPLMFEILPTPKETALIYSGREIRHVYTDGRPHTAPDDLWPTFWGDSIGHWEGQTLVIDTIAVSSPFAEGVVPVFAFGGEYNASELITILTPQARYVERIRMLDHDHLEDRMTITDPAMLSAPWQVTRTFSRVTSINRMIHEDCEGEDRNPVVDGKNTLIPPPAPQPPGRPPTQQ